MYVCKDVPQPSSLEQRRNDKLQCSAIFIDFSFIMKHTKKRRKCNFRLENVHAFVKICVLRSQRENPPGRIVSTVT